VVVSLGKGPEVLSEMKKATSTLDLTEDTEQMRLKRTTKVTRN
jgi:hypothetical protein